MIMSKFVLFIRYTHMHKKSAYFNSIFKTISTMHQKQDTNLTFAQEQIEYTLSSNGDDATMKIM